MFMTIGLSKMAATLFKQPSAIRYLILYYITNKITKINFHKENYCTQGSISNPRSV